VNEAKTMATNAQNTANSAVTKADNAQKTANDGVNKANTAQTTANNANNNANGRVPNTRKVNGKQLNADITLNAGDVGALGSNQALGFGQDYQDVTSSREINKDYKNDTNRPIAISITGRSNGTHHSYFKVNGRIAGVFGGSDTVA